MATATSPNPNQQTPAQIQNFLEALRERNAHNPQPNLESFTQKQELEKRRVAEFHSNRLAEWRSIYSTKDKQIQEAIKEIREKLEQLAQNVARFDQNVSQAVFTPVAKPGVYHQSFFEHIQNIIEFLQQQVSDSNSWLAAYRKRSKGRGFYREQADQRGTSFTLHDERQLATSVG